ncbi:MAG: ABC transporter permease, partial [Clostridia bacterium]|nr:ABC transporter permease [Clostridia bacterium]
MTSAVADNPAVRKDYTRVPRDPEAGQRIHRQSLTYFQGVVRTLKQNKSAMISLVFIILLILLAIIGPLVLPDYQKQDLLHTLEAPSAKHWLGT